MRVIKEGKPQSEKLYRGSCNYCRCEVDFKAEEAEYRSFPRNEQVYVVKCPTPKCGHEIYVDI
jgi:hypothetical protein